MGWLGSSSAPASHKRSDVARARHALQHGRYVAHLTRRYSRGDVIVFSMSKVGSTAMRQAAADALGHPVLHCHTVTKAGVTDERGWWLAQDGTANHRWTWNGDFARWRMTFDRRVPTWHIINGVRDPMARSVSQFFQVCRTAGVLGPEVDGRDADLDRLAAMYVELSPGMWDWFRREFEPATGIDVYDRPFDHTAGHLVYERGRFRQLLIRNEDLVTVGPAAMAALLGVSSIQLNPANAAAHRSYAEIYRRFQVEVRLPTELVDRAYDSELARHFYTPAERKRFRERWLDRG